MARRGLYGIKLTPTLPGSMKSTTKYMYKTILSLASEFVPDAGIIPKAVVNIGLQALVKGQVNGITIQA